MNIAVASGKGGAGKTTISVALAMAGAGMGFHVTLADCDVEEPNGFLSMDPVSVKEQEAFVMVPLVHRDRCNGCGKCESICRFAAIMTIRNKAVPFNGLCHSCLGCQRVCDQGAIEMVPQSIGTIHRLSVKAFESGKTYNYVNGLLRVGNPMSPPLIKRVLESVEKDLVSCKTKGSNGTQILLIDCPPGTSCPMVSSIEDSHIVLLVAEPTMFGLSDLQLAVETITQLKKPYTVLINRFVTEDNPVTRWCNRNSISIIHEVDFSLDTASALSKGEPLLSVLPSQTKQFERILTTLMAQHSEGGCS